MHVTDWLPTLMGLATGGQWSGALFGAELDGVDQWSALTSLGQSPRSEIVHYHDGVATSSVQIDMWKLNLGDSMRGASSPLYVFEADLVPDDAHKVCSKPSLVAPEESFLHALSLFSRQKVRDPMRSYRRSEDEGSDGVAGRGHLFNSTNIAALIGALLAVVALMSARLATVLASEPDEAAPGVLHAVPASSSSQLWKGGGSRNSSPTPTETSKLLV